MGRGEGRCPSTRPFFLPLSTTFYHLRRGPLPILPPTILLPSSPSFGGGFEQLGGGFGGRFEVVWWGVCDLLGGRWWGVVSIN